MRIKLREYKMTDYEQLEQLFYNTVHIVNAKDYTEEQEADVTIGRIKGKTTFVALASYPLKRNRFILMCLLPFVLGLVPFILFVISPAEFRVFNGLNFGMACMGMVSPFPDVFNVLAVLRNFEKSDSIMFYKNDMYKIS